MAMLLYGILEAFWLVAVGSHFYLMGMWTLRCTIRPGLGGFFPNPKPST